MTGTTQAEEAERVAPIEAAPTVSPAPGAVIQTIAPANGPGVSYFSQPLFQVRATMPAPSGPAREVTAPERERSLRDLLHPDVVLPLVAAIIVLVLYLAWAA